MSWTPQGMYFWKDYAPGMEPYFGFRPTRCRTGRSTIPVTLVPVFNIAVGGSGRARSGGGSYPAEIAGHDWIRVFQG